MDEIDELDIDLQDTDDIGSRLVLLSALVLWPDLDAGEQEQWFSWLKLQGALDIAMPDEVDLLRSPGPDSEDESALATEALLPLAWSVGLIVELPDRAEPDVVKTVLESLPVPPERVEPFLDGLIMLDENAIAVERERVEVWNWRLSAEIVRRASHGVGLVEITEAIREVVLEAAASFVIIENDGTDFLIEGVPVRNLDPEALGWALFASEERLRALNWVCGLTEWDQIDISD